MQNIFALIMLCGCVMLMACGGNTDYDGNDLVGATVCHQKFHKRAYNKPYEVKGQTYHPQKHYEYSATGTASYYGGGDVFHGRKTSNGEIFDMNLLSAAHKTIPIPAVVLVTNLENGRALKLKVNDRGPFKHDRIIDVSRKAARMLGFEHKGLVKVRVETLVPESIVLADSIAKGTHHTSPFYDQQVMLAQTLTSNKVIKKRSKPQPMHLAQEIIIPSKINPKGLNVEHDHQQLHLHPSIYSTQKLPNISLTARTQSIKKAQYLYNKESVKAQLEQQPVQAQSFFIRTGTFNRFTHAQKLITLFNQSSPKIKAKMQPVTMNNQQMFRVVVGPFAKKSQANFYVDQLKNLDKRSAVITH